MPTPADSGEENKGSTPPQMVLGAGVGSLLQQNDPYTGQPWQGTMLGPYSAGELLQDAYCEAPKIRTHDDQGTGFGTGWRQVEMKLCMRCGEPTSRTVILWCELEDWKPGAGGMLRVVVPQEGAICVKCARAPQQAPA